MTKRYFLITIIVAIAVLHTAKLPVFADALCGEDRYCLGTGVLDRYESCQVQGNYCVQKYQRISFTCNSECVYSTSGEMCDDLQTPCDSTPTTQTTGCCMEGGGGEPGDPPVDPLTGRISGIVWSDDNGNGSIDYPDEKWGDSSISCQGHTASLTFTESGSNALDSWYCGANGSRYQTKFWPEGSKLSIRVSGFDTNMYECNYWNYTVCKNDDCSQTESSSGSGCTATITVPEQSGIEDGNKNYLDFALRSKNQAPIASISASTPQISPLGGGSVNVTGNASDSNGNLTSMSFWRARQGTQDWVGFPTNSNNVITCSGANCTGTTENWTPSTLEDLGYWTIAVNAFDSGGLKCTGNWEMPQVGWSDCGTSDNLLLRVCGMRPAKPALNTPANSAKNIPYSQTVFIWDISSFGGRCDGITQENQIITIIKRGETIYSGPPSPGGGPINYTHRQPLEPSTTYSWYVTASNGEFSNTSDIWTFTTLPEQASSCWFTSLGGDVYGGGMTINGPTNAPAAPWASYDYVANRKPSALAGSLFTPGQIDLIGLNSDLVNTDEQGVWAEYMDTTGFWPESFDPFVRPSGNGVKTITGESTFSELDPAFVYIMDNPAYLPSTFDLTTAGVVVIYYIGNDELKFTSDFVHTQPNEISEKVIFVTNNDITFDSSIVTPGATATSNPNIQAGFLTSETVTINEDIVSGIDDPIVIEGFILSPGVIDFRRITDGNSYPGAVIRYNPYYLTKLSEQIRESELGAFNGLVDYEIVWEGD